MTDGAGLPRASAVAIDLLFLSFLWVVAVLIVNPLGDFPLNDDWSYGLATRRLVEEGAFRPTGWTAMTLVSQTVWGALFCLPAGFSFTAVRFSTLAASLLGVCAAYFLAVHLGRPRWLAVMLALTLAFNTMYFALSHTFMTDVPFTAVTTFALLCLMKHVRSGSLLWLLLGTLASTAAVLCRQSGLVIPLAFATALIVKHGPSRRVLLRAGPPLVAGIASWVLLGAWLSATGSRPAQYPPPIAAWRALGVAPADLFGHAASPFLYLGLFAMPLLAAFAPVRDSKTVRRGTLVVGTLFAIGVSGGLAYLGRTMPVMRFASEGNVLDLAGIGPVTLRDTFFLKLPHLEPLPPVFWLLVTMAAVLGGALLSARLAVIAIRLAAPGPASAEEAGERADRVFLFAAAALSAIPFLFTPRPFDRYLLPVIPALYALLITGGQNAGAAPRRLRLGIACILLGAFAVFSVGGTRDYLSWNRARWRALRELTDAQGVSPSKIDGGFEFNGLYLYHPAGSPGGGSKSWWWVDDDEYLIALGPVDGYRTVATHGFSRWLPPGRGRIAVLRRVP